MAGTPPGTILAAVMLLVSSSCACPDPCACPRAPLVNCSSAGLSSAPRLLRASVAELDLSHNLLEDVGFDRPRPNLRVLWLGDNGLARLSLCVDRYPGPRSRLRGSRTRGGRGCESWAPGLQLLSAERNQLQQLPLGLEGSESLQVLQLSFNRISVLQPGDLCRLRQLKELHLQHNLISSLHPQMFQDLAQLRVLDLSFNMLTSLQPLTYLSLRNIGSDVRLDGNRWQCDCSMRGLRRRMADDGSRGLQAWSMVCASPSALSGRDLLLLEEDELNCLSTENGPELHRDVTVYRGSEILLSCAAQGSVRWTPKGEASGSQSPAGLVISDIKETDTGLYVCVSETHKVVSVFNLQISKVGGAKRKTRSLTGTGRQIIQQGTPNRTGQERNQRATQSDLTLAVCLSVFITFLIAFILGVLARPCIDVLWRRATKKKSSSATNSVLSTEQRQYDNEAFSNGEEPEHIGTRRERRVTFSTVDYREDNNVKYYDTVVIGNLEGINNDAVIECEAAERDTNRAGDSGSENSSRQSGPEENQRSLSGFTEEDRTQKNDFEHIPDPVEQRRRSSTGSGSSLSDKGFSKKVTRGDHSTLESRQLAEDSVQQRADCSTPTKVEVPQLTIEGKDELSVFSTEPFADWSPYANNINHSDPGLWQENEEPFEFSDSVRSTSTRSSGVGSSFNDSKRIVVPTFDKQKTDDASSSSSYVSEGEQTRYTVNSEQVEEILESNLKQDANFEKQVRNQDAIRPSVQFNQGDYRNETQRPAKRPQDSSSSRSSDSDSGGNDVKKGRVPSLAVTSHGKSLNTGSPSSPAAYSSSSSSESEAERITCRLNEGIKINEPETLSTDFNRQYIHKTKRRVDIITPLTASDSSSSNDGMDQTKPTKKQGQGEMNMVGLPIKSGSNDTINPQLSAPDVAHAKPIKRPAPLPPTDSYSRVQPAAKTANHKQKQGEMHTTSLPIGVSPTGSHDPDTRWPALDLQQAIRIKKRLDIKGPSPPPDSSSSSDSEDETTHYTEKPVKVDIAGPPVQVSQTRSHEADTTWPALDLQQTMRIKRRLDIKGPSPPPDSSSSSDSEDETTDHIKKQKQEEVSTARLPSKVSQTVHSDPQTQWPLLDLERTTRIKRRLDIKGPSPDLSSSSDSEDEITRHTQRPRNVDIAGPPVQEPQTGSHDPDTRWPAFDLHQAMRIKKRLDIKGPSPSPDSSSSGDSEDETLNNAKVGLGVSAVSKTTENEFIRLPKTSVINMSRSPKMDQNIKLERYSIITDQVEDKSGGNLSTTPEINPELQSRWATMNLGVSRFRKRLEITSQTHEPPNLPPSLPPDSPTSSSSGSGTKSSRTKEKKRGVGSQGQIKTEPLLRLENKPVNVSQSVGGQGDISVDSVEVTERLRKDYNQPKTEGNPDATLTGFRIPHFRRYLDIKVKENASDTPPLQQLPDSSSSSSENEDALIKFAGEGWRKETSQEHSSLYVAQAVNIKPDESQNQLVQGKAGLELKSQTYSVEPRSNLTNIPHIRKALDIRLQKESSPSSSVEAETKGLRVPDLSLGVPRVKRRLNVKAPLPSNSPSSCSESENDVTGSTSNRSRPASNMSAMMEDDSLITYKRVIIKTPSLPSNVFSPSGDYKQRYMGTESVAQEGPPLATMRVSSMIIDDVLKKRTQLPGRIADVDMPPDIRWTGVGRQLSDLSIPSLRRHLDVGLSSPPAESVLPPPDSSTSESDNTIHDKGRAEVPLMPIHLSLGDRSVSLPSSRALDPLKVASEARTERKGLGALKAMSSERRKWDTIDETVAVSASPRDYGLQGDTRSDYRKSGEEFKASTSRVTDLLYIPRYRRHDIGGTEPPQGAPPPVPATPPPPLSPSYEASGLTWRSPLSGNKLSSNTEESVRSSMELFSHFTNENISEV